jgi:threonine dehydrogenase-like Zn-dependent dehydrogenase
MRVPVLVGLSRIEFQERPKPVIGAGQALIKVEYCGICGSDVHGYARGNMVPVGTVMGHECVGVVAEVGEGVQNCQVGDRVAVKPLPQCGTCYWCRRGQYSLCPKALERAMGISPRHDGAFAEYVKIEYPHEMIFQLPSNVSFEDAVLADPLACSLHAVRISRFKPGDATVVIGAGTIGLGTLQFLKIGGAGKIIVLEIESAKMRAARELGADVVINPLSGTHDLREQILELTDGIGAAIVFECAGSPVSLPTSINCVKAGGQVIVVGIYDKEVPVNPLTFVISEVEIKGSAAYNDEFTYVLDFLGKKRLNTKVLISDTISLPDLEEKGLKELLSCPDKIKIVVRP